MHETIEWLWWLAQIAPNAPDAGGGAGKQAGAGDTFNMWTCLLPAAAGLMLMYLMMASKPRQADSQKSREALASLKKNDRVITAGGILGTVVQTGADSEYVTIRIDDTNNVRIKLLKSSIAKVVTDESNGKEKES
jgi:preprotein translocase subunit YajC